MAITTVRLGDNGLNNPDTVGRHLVVGEEGRQATQRRRTWKSGISLVYDPGP